VSSLGFGLALAVAASVALNAGFLLQHAGSAGAPAVSARRPVATLRGLLGSRLWLAGLGLGLAGWALHVDALSHAPLSLVQAFVAGGLVLAVPLALALGHRLDRGELRAVVVLAAALALLCAGARAGRPPAIDAPALAAGLAAAGALAAALAALAPRAGPAALGAAGGVLYGAGDMAVKALTTVAHHGGAGAVLRSPWLAAAALATAGAFFCFQRALQTGPAVPVIGLMTAATNLVSILGGLAVLGDPLGRTPALAALHVAAFALVVVAAWRLAPTQATLQGTYEAPATKASAMPAPMRAQGSRQP
jgi:drug/metabolite transporter (DMT)-like permease